jgi:uncharacterized protein YbcI
MNISITDGCFCQDRRIQSKMLVIRYRYSLCMNESFTCRGQAAEIVVERTR